MPLLSIQNNKHTYIALVGCIPRRLARAIAQMMVRVRTLAPQPSEFYGLVSRESGSANARLRFQDGSADVHIEQGVVLSEYLQPLFQHPRVWQIKLTLLQRDAFRDVDAILS